MKSFLVLLFISSLAQANPNYHGNANMERLNHHQEMDKSKHAEQNVCHQQSQSEPCDSK